MSSNGYYNEEDATVTDDDFKEVKNMIQKEMKFQRDFLVKSITECDRNFSAMQKALAEYISLFKTLDYLNGYNKLEVK